MGVELRHELADQPEFLLGAPAELGQLDALGPPQQRDLPLLRHGGVGRDRKRLADGCVEHVGSADHAVALQGTAMSGMGYAAVGTLHGTNETDYHYGIAPQAVLASRFIFGDRASIDLAGREYFVSNVAAAATGGHDNILRGDASFAVRIHQQRAIAVKYVWSRRDALYPGQGTVLQLRGTLGIFYTLLGHDRFGAVDWQ